MINPFLYNSLYYVIISILTIGCIYRYSLYNENRIVYCNRKSSIIPSLILIIACALFIGFRPFSVAFADMINYLGGFEGVQAKESFFIFDKEQDNFIFDNLLIFLAVYFDDPYVFFVTIAVIYFGCMLWAIRKIFPHDTWYALLVYLGAFSTFSYGTNGIKAGAAASIFLLAFAYYRHWLLVLIFCFLSLGFHHSMTLPIVGLVLAYFIREPKYFLICWLFCLILAFFQIPGITEFLSQFADDRGQGYLEADGELWGGKLGFRWDFILYGLPPILIGAWVYYRLKIKDRLYQLLICYYTFINGIWLLCMYIPFNNRIAYLSWFALPILIVYPFFKLKLDTRQYIQLNYVVGIYLIFTLSFFLI